MIERRRDEQRQHEQRLDDVGHPPVDPGGGEEARSGAQGGEHERRRDRHEDAVARDEGDEQTIPAIVPRVADRQPVAGGPAGQQHGAGDAGETSRSHEHGGGQRPAGYAESLGGAWIETEDVDPGAEPRASDDVGDDRGRPEGEDDGGVDPVAEQREVRQPRVEGDLLAGVDVADAVRLRSPSSQVLTQARTSATGRRRTSAAAWSSTSGTLRHTLSRAAMPAHNPPPTAAAASVATMTSGPGPGRRTAT